MTLTSLKSPPARPAPHSVRNQTTENSETGFAGRGRRLEKSSFAHSSPPCPSPCSVEWLSVQGPKGSFSNCFPRPAKRASVRSVVKTQRRPAVTQSKAIPWARESKIWYNMNQRATQKTETDHEVFFRQFSQTSLAPSWRRGWGICRWSQLWCCV